MLFHNSPTCLWYSHSFQHLPSSKLSLCSLAISIFMLTLLLTHFPLPSLTSSHPSTSSNMSTSQLILRITPLTFSSHPLHLYFLLRYYALLSTSLTITSSWLTSTVQPLS